MSKHDSTQDGYKKGDPTKSWCTCLVGKGIPEPTMESTRVLKLYK